MKCMNDECKKDFIVIIPLAEIANKETVSMVIWAHPDVQNCPHCGTPYQMTIKKISGVHMAWGPVKTKGDAGIVVVPPGFKIPKPNAEGN